MSTAKSRPKTRLSANERRQAILVAAAPILAQEGLQGASVKSIAEAAGVSEALLYKHFPSKQAIYDETLAQAREFSRFTISRFSKLTPGTDSFVLLTYATIHFILFGFPGRAGHEQGAARLLFQSLLGDGKYARSVFADTAASWMDYVMASFNAAVACGDIAEMDVAPTLRFRFVQQLAMALRLSHLPDPPAFDYRGSTLALANEATLFSLRGVGLTDRAIQIYFRPDNLAKSLDDLFPGDSARRRRLRAN